MPSQEYLALKGLNAPTQANIGDMWLCRRLGIVLVFNGHKKGRGRRYPRLNSFHLYHWEKPSLYAHPSDWRNDDPNSGGIDPIGPRPSGETWECIGNIFEMLPYSLLSGRHT